MNGQEWLADLPEFPGPERDKRILSAIENDLVRVNYLPIESIYQSHNATFYVCQDAAHVLLEDESRFRFPVSATLAQKCADLLGATLLTSKISDLTYQQTKTKLPATILPATPDMASTSRSKQWNRLLEQKRKVVPDNEFVRDCGKAWIVSNKLGARPNIAVNYGFYDDGAPYQNRMGQKMWQTAGTRHDSTHTDYSQTLVVMLKFCQVDGKETEVTELMQDPKLCWLLSDEGVLRYMRQQLF